MRTVEIVALAGNRLMGTRFLQDSEIYINVCEGGEVQIVLPD